MAVGVLVAFGGVISVELDELASIDTHCIAHFEAKKILVTDIK